MIFNCLTIFPEMFQSFTDTSLLCKAIEKGIVEVNAINFRDYTEDKHRRVDDYPFGGGAGMLLTPQPLFSCFEDITERHRGERQRNIYLSPSGTVLSQSSAKRLCEDYDVLNLLCGHYEGVDQRVLDCLIDEEISIGDYILTGGELPAMVLMDCVMRYVPGFLSNDESVATESFDGGLLEYPQYTRPQEFRGMGVPEVLLSGHHKNIEQWRREQSLAKTSRLRPDLLAGIELSPSERDIITKSEKQA